MAKRKRDWDEKMIRGEAEAVVDRFLEVALSSDSDAGWEGMCLLGKIIDFKGEFPKSPGRSGCSSVYEQSKRLGDWGDEHHSSCTMMLGLSDRKREALCIDRACRGRTKVAVDPFTPEHRVEILWDDKACAQLLGCSIQAFRQRVLDGYRSLEEKLESQVTA